MRIAFFTENYKRRIINKCKCSGDKRQIYF